MPDTDGPEALSGSESSDDDGEVLVVDIKTPREILTIGLRLVNYTWRRIRRAKAKTNINRFKGHFGTTPVVCAQVYEDLQRNRDPEVKIEPKDLCLSHLLMALHHLKRYPTELEREPIFDISYKWGRDKVWYYVERIRALKKYKIVWPDDNFGEDIWILTVDGTHFWVNEPQHPEWSQDSEYFSHKYGKAGLNYELGISLTTQQLIWMNGPFPAGSNDVKIFIQKGLKQKLLEVGKRGIGDGGYNGHQRAVSTPNAHDSKPVKKFKGRALKRHETFNGLIKEFDCLDGRFRHSVKRFQDSV